MCYVYDALRGSAPGSDSSFFGTYSQAKKFAVKSAKIIENYWCYLTPEIPPKTFIFYVKIFKIPLEGEVVIETVYDIQTTAAMIIQRKWKPIYNRRFVAAVIIKKHARRAISNPYTQLCRNRLMREFTELTNYSLF